MVKRRRDNKYEITEDGKKVLKYYEEEGAYFFNAMP